MTQMVNFELARIADRRAVRGETGREIAAALKVPTPQARMLANVGARKREIEGAFLTMPEQLLIQHLVNAQVALLRSGEIRSPKSKEVSRRAGKADGWAAATAQKRIFNERYDNAVGMHVNGMGFVEVAGNGYIWLTQAGWALAHAMSMVPND
ncbi:unknown [Sinorhizobium phage PBC5]|uniref:hypothetical protein n=1 Tax=Sinorhizobium phage PBC5 TaxID=179237 RepID=UPI000009B853|nr:hypothetical protein PBC5_gp56 [Sinorhizobium phage PBC5]AAL49628.1 unknown [Sinorhizobium phage PBC5]